MVLGLCYALMHGMRNAMSDGTLDLQGAISTTTGQRPGRGQSASREQPWRPVAREENTRQALMRGRHAAPLGRVAAEVRRGHGVNRLAAERID